MSVHRYQVVDPPTLDAFLEHLADVVRHGIPLRVTATPEADELSARRDEEPKEPTLCFRLYELTTRPWSVRAQRIDTNEWATFTYDEEKEVIILEEVS